MPTAPIRIIPSPRQIVLVGGGLAATRCAQTLRGKGYDGRFTVVCAEEHPPYDRPPLSKGQLAGGDTAPALLRPAGWWAEQDVELRLGRRATGLRPHERRVGLNDGSELAYDRLLIATGSAPRPAPGALAGRDGVHTLRDLDDTLRLRAALTPGARLLVIGAGLIGLEVASTARQLGCEVTVLEAADRPLGRALPPALADWLIDLHRRNGVRVELGARIASVEGEPSVRAVVLADGRRIASDVVLAAIGVDPDTAWLAGGGLPADGVPVDARGETVRWRMCSPPATAR